MRFLDRDYLVCLLLQELLCSFIVPFGVKVIPDHLVINLWKFLAQSFYLESLSLFRRNVGLLVAVLVLVERLFFGCLLLFVFTRIL